jgi:hypothetical protein
VTSRNESSLTAITERHHHDVLTVTESCGRRRRNDSLSDNKSTQSSRHQTTMTQIERISNRIAMITPDWINDAAAPHTSSPRASNFIGAGEEIERGYRSG